MKKIISMMAISIFLLAGKAFCQNSEWAGGSDEMFKGWYRGTTFALIAKIVWVIIPIVLGGFVIWAVIKFYDDFF